MGPWGALIMSFFGASFFAWASVLAAGRRTPLFIVPLIVWPSIAYSAWRLINRAARGAYAPPRRAARIMSWASAGEGVGIPIVALALANTGHQDVVLPGIAAVVGLHFLPMAWAIPFKPLYGPAASLLSASAIGFGLSQPAGSILVGVVSAITLWVASIFALWRVRRTPASSSIQA